MALVLLAVVVVVPLVIAPGFLFYFDVTPKVVLLLTGTAGAALLIVRPRTPATEWPKVVRWFAILLAIHALTVIAATAASTHWQFSIGGTNWRRFGVVTQLAVLAFAAAITFALAGGPGRMRVLLPSIAAAGIVAAAYGTAQYFGHDPWLPNDAYMTGEGEWAIIRPPSTLGHAGYAATYYLFAVFAGIGLARIDSGRAWRVLGVFAAALGSLAIVLSGTRAGILGLFAGAMLLAFLWRPRLTARRIALTAVVVIAFGAFYVSPAGQKLRSRTRWSLEDPRGGGRLLLWRDSLKMAATRPVLGWGPETFWTEFPRWQSRELSKLYPDFYYESPHNIFIDAFVSTGAVGLAVLVALCGIGFYAAWLARAKAPVESAVLAAALAGGIVAQQFTVFVVPTALYLYMTIAMLVALATGSASINIPRSLVVTTVAVVLCGIWVVYGVRLFAADRLLARAQAALDHGEPKAATELYLRSRRRQPPGGTADLSYSRALGRFAQSTNHFLPRMYALEQGYIAAENAVRSAEDRHNAFYNLATYCALRDDFAGVEENLRNAIEWAPNWFKPHWTLAQSLQLAGRMDEAEIEAALAVELDAGKHPEVSRTLEEIRRERAGGNSRN